MTVIRIICVDSSGSTSGCGTYWDFVERLARKHGSFDHILHWNSRCDRVNVISEIHPTGTTLPQVFLQYIIDKLSVIDRKNRKKIELYVTTDGEISDEDIEQCVEYVDVLGPYLAFVNVYYVGYENCMNFGLNAVFGSMTQLQYFVNDMSQVHSVWTLEQLQASIANKDIHDENFIPSLVSRVKYVQATLRKAPNDALLRQLEDMRQQLIKILDNETKTSDTQIVRECYESNDGKRLEREIKSMLFLEDAVERTKLRSKILACFDHTSGLQLSDIRRSKVAKTKVKSIAKSAKSKDVATESTWNVEDCITFDQIDPSCVSLMIQTNHEPLLDPDSSYVRNPISILENDALCENIFKHFEMHTLSFETVQKLKPVGTSGREFESAYTRAICRPFALDPCDWARVLLNSFAISHLFKKNSDNGKFIYGNKLLWNFAFLCLIKKQVGRLGGEGESVSWNRESVVESVESALRKFYFNESFLYPLTLHLKIVLPFKSGFPLYIVMWYINRVAPFYAENTTRNVLRLPGTRTLFDLYKEYGRREEFDTEASMAALENRVNIWNLWNTMMERRTDREFGFVIRASYQNYVVIEDKIVLLSGPLQGSPPALVASFRPALVSHLFGKLSANSSRHEDLSLKGDDGSEGLEEPRPIVLNDASDQSEPSEFPFHIDIDLRTCRPSEICPVTKRPAKECAPTDEYDVRSGSYAKVFNLYCTKKKKYPENSSQLVLIHNRRRAKDNVSTRHIQKYLDHIFEIHRPVMEKYSCEEYLKIYDPDRR